MLGLVFGAIRRRKAQAALLFLLGAIAAAGAAAAPGYIAASVQKLAAASVPYATAGERVIAVDADLLLDQAPPSQKLREFSDNVRAAMPLKGYRSVADMRLTGAIASTSTVLAYREDACAEVVVVGSCPSATNEVAVSGPLAESLGLKAGDTITYDMSAAKPLHVSLRVVGVFRPRSPYDPYWGISTGTTAAPQAGARLRDSLLLTDLSTLDGVGAPSADASVDLIATTEAFRLTDPQQILLASWRGTDVLLGDAYQVKSGLEPLADRVWTDQQLVLFGVPVGAVQLMVICWFALFLAVRQTGEERRPDVAKLKLHGARRRDIWVLIAGQSVLPLLFGGAVGLWLGTQVARWLGGEVVGAELNTIVLAAAVGAAAVAVLGAIIAALLAERRTVRESVADLGRRVHGLRPRWRSGVFDIAILTVALAGAYQLRTGDDSPAQLRGLTVAAPLLVALAAGVLTARLLPVLANAAAPSLLRARRVGSWLAAVHLARRSGRSRVLVLLTLAVAILANTALAWSASRGASLERARFEVGADRVLTVSAPSRSALLAAVRGVDPDGRFAMAATQTSGTLPVLAVDSSRMAAVMPWQSEYGVPEWSEVARALHPRSGSALTVTSGRLAVDATWTPAEPDAGAVAVVLRLVTSAGAPTTLTFGPLATGRRSYQAESVQCGQGCRIVSVELASASGKTSPAPPTPGSMVALHTLRQTGPDATVIDQAAFGDRTLWRNDVRPNVRVADLSTSGDGLRITVAPLLDEGTLSAAARLAFPAPVYALDAPTPLPVVAVGELPPVGEVGDPRAPIFGGAAAPIRIASRAYAVPRLASSANKRGTSAGLLTDLEYADRLLPAEPTVGTMQVWLNGSAPADVVERLGAAGLTVASSESVADRLGGLRTQGPPVALEFLVLVAGAGMLLALGSFAVWAAVERHLRGRELMALRWQGMPESTARAAAFGGYLAFVAVALVVGAGLALALRSVDRSSVFADDWALLPMPGPDKVVAPAALGIAAVLLGATAVAAGLAVLRTARRTQDRS
jgi:putative ABC transport system permease protein